MLSIVSSIMGVFEADIDRVKKRAKTAAILYSLAAVAGLLMIACLVSAAIVGLAAQIGMIAALLSVGGGMAFVVALCLVLNAVLSRKHQRAAKRAAAVRNAAVSSAALSAGLLGSGKMKLLLPVAVLGMVFLYARRNLSD